jgi:hypothetical protein
LTADPSDSLLESEKGNSTHPFFCSTSIITMLHVSCKT